jgi:hypothetical protein
MSRKATDTLIWEWPDRRGWGERIMVTTDPRKRGLEVPNRSVLPPTGYLDEATTSAFEDSFALPDLPPSISCLHSSASRVVVEPQYRQRRLLSRSLACGNLRSHWSDE